VNKRCNWIATSRHVAALLAAEGGSSQ
jgi:hypothetical protein